MKIDLQQVDVDNFVKHEHIVNGEVLTLIIPVHVGAKFTQQNKMFRSSVWNSDGELVSAGLPKFTNWGENPENFPVPTSLTGTTIMEKLDGSLLIVSKYKGFFILRTRGTVNARQLDNGYELDIFEQKYLPNLISFIEKTCNSISDTWNISYLFEWTSPVNKIVLNYGDIPDWNLVGAVGHADYSLSSQEMLDGLAAEIGCPRPATYTFSSVDDLLNNVELWKGKEGVCVYSNGGQSIHKVKGAWYLALHHMKSELSSTEKVLDVWLNQNMPSYMDFYNYIVNTFDYELAEQCRGHASKICEAWKEVEKIHTHMLSFVDDVKRLSSRKEQAQKIIGAYGNTNRASFLFKLLDGKMLNNEDYKKLMFQVMKSRIG